MERRGLEPPTPWLQTRCSPAELPPQVCYFKVEVENAGVIGTLEGGTRIKAYDTSSSDSLTFAISEDNSGKFILLAKMDNSILLIKLDSLGNPIWNKSYSTVFPVAVRKTLDGYAILGIKGSLPILIKTDNSGNINWVKRISIVSFLSSSLVQNSRGGYTIVGSSPKYIVILDLNSDSVYFAKFYSSPDTFSNLNIRDII